MLHDIFFYQNVTKERGGITLYGMHMEELNP